MSEEVNLQNVESRIYFFLADEMPQNLMIRRMIEMHIDWEFQYVDIPCPFQSSPSLHTSQNQNPTPRL